MKLSEMATELEAARQLVYYAASMKDSGTVSYTHLTLPTIYSV